MSGVLRPLWAYRIAGQPDAVVRGPIADLAAAAGIPVVYSRVSRGYLVAATELDDLLAAAQHEGRWVIRVRDVERTPKPRTLTP